MNEMKLPLPPGIAVFRSATLIGGRSSPSDKALLPAGTVAQEGHVIALMNAPAEAM